MIAMTNEVTNRTCELQAQLIKKLMREDERLRKQIKLTEEENRFLTNVVASALESKETHTAVYREYDNPKFDLRENFGGDMLIVLRSNT